MSAPPQTGRDSVDAALEVWARELPQIDLETEGIVERIGKLARLFWRSLDETAEAFGLTQADWHLLGALKGRGAPYRLPAGRLADRLSISPAALTSRVDKLEERGWVRRVADTEDRRVHYVELTDEGHTAWGEAVAVQAEKERLVADALDEEQKRELNALLRRLMLEFGAGPKDGC